MGKAKEDMMRMRIMEKLNKTDRLTTEDAVALLQVSESSVRRLFRKMEESNDIIHVYGGIKANPASNLYHYDRIYSHDIEAKHAIGLLAAQQVESGDNIFIDCGTTTVHMVAALADYIQKGELSDITVVTNSLANLDILAPYCLAILAGGYYNPERKSFAGYLCESFVSQFHFKKSFVGADTFTFEDGFSTSDVDFSRLSGLAAKISDTAYVLMDSSKVGKSSFITYDRYERIKHLITDSRMCEEHRRRFKEMGIDPLIARVEKGEKNV